MAATGRRKLLAYLATLIALVGTATLVDPPSASASFQYTKHPVVYAGNYGATFPWEVDSAWAVTTDSSCDSVKFTIAVHAFFSKVTSKNVTITKIQVVETVANADKALWGGAVDLYGTSNYFHTTDYGDAPVTKSRGTVTKTWNINKTVPWDNHQLVFRKIVLPSPYDEQGTAYCASEFYSEYTYHS
jgi:hypothetical protein